MLITIFTPTYNRGSLLNNLFLSLLEQSKKVFEWIIVDDGSSDDTKIVVQKFIESADFPIRYIYQENQGKHIAINCGVQNALGELFFIVDSDDYLPHNAIEVIVNQYSSIRFNEKYCGLCGIKAFFDYTPVCGKIDFQELHCSSLDFRFKYKVKGDVAEVFKTSIIKQYSFPKINGEKFCPEGLINNRMSTNYIIKYFKDIIYLCEYRKDGLSANIIKVRYNSPSYSMLYYSEFTNLKLPVTQIIKAGINFWRFYKSDSSIIKSIHLNPYVLPLFPFGMLYKIVDYILLRHN